MGKIKIFKIGLLIILMILGKASVCKSKYAMDSTQTPVEVHRVVVKGVGVIIGGNVAKAEEDAINNALKNAIEQTIVEMVPTKILVQNYQILEREIYNQASHYIRSYRVLVKNEIENYILEVTIEGEIVIDQLEDALSALGILQQKQGSPRLYILLSVNSVNLPYSIFAKVDFIGRELKNTLMKNGFQYVDVSDDMMVICMDLKPVLDRYDIKVVRKVAEEVDADIVIYGYAAVDTINQVPMIIKQSGMIVSRATIYFHAIRATDGKLIAKVWRDATATHTDSIKSRKRALQKATHLAALSLGESILEQWQAIPDTGRIIQLRVLNVPTFDKLLILKNWLLSRVPGVQTVQQWILDGGTALLNVVTSLGSKHLAQEIASRSMHDSDGMIMEVLSVSRNSIVLKSKRGAKNYH